MILPEVFRSGRVCLADGFDLAFKQTEKTEQNKKNINNFIDQFEGLGEIRPLDDFVEFRTDS